MSTPSRLSTGRLSLTTWAGEPQEPPAGREATATWLFVVVLLGSPSSQAARALPSPSTAMAGLYEFDAVLICVGVVQEPSTGR